MKYILSTILISLILTSCSTSEEQQSIISSVPVIQSGTIQTDTITSSVPINTGTISTGSMVAKVRTLGMENNNVILWEDGKKLDSLTTKGNIDFSNVESCDVPKEKTAYKILQATGEYGIVQKVWNTCGGVVEKVYYSIPLTSNVDTLQEVYKGFDTVKVNSSTISIINTDEVVNIENEEGMGMVAKSTLIKEGYKQEGKYWIKVINLSSLPNSKEVQKIEIQKPISLNGMYLYKGDSEDYSIVVKNVSDKSFQVEMTSSNDDNKAGMDDGTFKIQSDGSWLMFLDGDGTSESPNCNNLKIQGKIENNTFIITSAEGLFECYSGMPPVKKAIYYKQ
ncbi:hypothetical protein HOO68_01215 [Candidatus Gracilibacteria bacterium]|nr:hypothetical protein [Candidatus Gracilibacteria bacterium]